jgi:hypothetical protein
MSGNKKQKIKKETVQEFLDRGGQIQRLPYIPPDTNMQLNRGIKSVPPMPAHQMSLDEGAHYFAERKQVKPKKADFSGIDMDLIPDSLKQELGI